MEQQEAEDFVTNVLGLSTPLSKLNENPTLFLNELVKAFHNSVPFQNVTLLCEPEADRRVPTWEESKKSMMRGHGGLCYTICVFIKYLLEALQYNVYFASCAIAAPDNHIATVVQNLSFPGSKHLVDVSGYPTFEAIPLDFEVESPVYYHSFLEYRFLREGSSILRMHRKGEHSPILPGPIIDGWRRVAEFDLTPRDLSHFEHSMNEVYTKPGKNSPFLVSFCAVIFRDLKSVAIKNDLLLLENDEQQLVVTKMATREDMIKTVREYFPMFTVEQISKAIECVRLFNNSVSSNQ